MKAKTTKNIRLIQKEKHSLEEKAKKIQKDPAYAEIVLSLSERAKDNGLIAEERGVKQQSTHPQMKRLLDVNYVKKENNKYALNYPTLLTYWATEYPELEGELNEFNIPYLMLVSRKMIKDLRIPITIEFLGQIFVWIIEMKNNKKELHKLIMLLIGTPEEERAVIFQKIAEDYGKKNPKKIKKAKQMKKKINKKKRVRTTRS